MDVCRRIGHDKTTSAHELERVAQGLFGRRWQGVVPSNRIPAGKPDSFLIANLQTDAPGNPGSHWVCRYTNEDGVCAWHDPLGEHGQEQRAQFERHVTQWTDDDAEQHPLETSCGQRCLAALCLARDHGLESFMLL